MATSSNQHRHISRSKATLLIGLAILIVAASVIFFSRLRPAHTQPHPHVNVPANSDTAMFGFDLQHTHFNPSEHILNITNIAHLVSYWMTSTGAYISSSPSVANGIVYIGSNDQKLYALDSKTGKTLWLHAADADVGSSPAGAQGFVYVGADAHKIYAFYCRTGATVWTFFTRGASWSAPPAADRMG